MHLFEISNPLHKLPQHWTKLLANRYGKNIDSAIYKDYAGEHSPIQELEDFSASSVKKAFDDENVLAIIGRMEGEPLFMITRHNQKSTKYMFFEVTSGKGYEYEKIKSYYHGGRRGKRDIDNSFFIKEIIEIVTTMIQDKNFSNITLESIYKDPERAKKVETRYSRKSIKDPFEIPKEKSYSDVPYSTQKQREIIKKYADLKRPKLDKKVDEEIEKIRNTLMQTIDDVLQKIAFKAKNGRTYGIDKDSFGKELAKQLYLGKLISLANIYSTLQGTWGDTGTPGDVARKLKKLGFH